MESGQVDHVGPELPQLEGMSAEKCLVGVGKETLRASGGGLRDYEGEGKRCSPPERAQPLPWLLQQTQSNYAEVNRSGKGFA